MVRVFALVFLAILVGAVVLVTWRSLWIRRRYNASFDQVFGDLPQRPTLKCEGSYGFPYFTVTFATRRDLLDAKNEGLTEQFATLIGTQFADWGDERNRFDARRAIHYTSQEDPF